MPCFVDHESIRCTKNSGEPEIWVHTTMDTYSHLMDGVDDDEVGGLDDAFGT